MTKFKTPDGKKLVVANAKGFGSGPNGGATFEPGPEGKIGKTGGFGLISMRERALGQNGKFEVQSGKGEGTVIRVSIPLS